MHALSTAGLARQCKPRAPWRDAGECIATVPVRCSFTATYQSAPRAPAEYIRREAGTHTPRQEELLRRWGYPFVPDEFRFHTTLTCELDQDERHALQ